MPPKYASPYSLVKNPIEQTKFYSIFDARNKQTNQIWNARVIHHQAIEKLQLSQYVAYNEQALLNMKEKEGVIYVSQIFTKNGDSFLIQEKHKVRLSQYLDRREVIEGSEVEKIIKDVFKSLCDIYEEGYVHRNIRPEHVVLIEGEGEEEGEGNQWKIQTLVLDNQYFSVDTPFTWRKSTASPEDQNKKEELEEEMLDAQVVWNFGYLGLQLVAGNVFMSRKMFKDADIRWSEIKKLCSRAPALYELIDKCFRFKFSDRASLKEFFDLRIFKDCQREGFGQYFLTASKIFKTKTFSSIQMSMRSMNLKSTNMQSRILKGGLTSPKAKPMLQIAELNIEEEDEINSLRGGFLLGVNDYLKHIESEEPANKLNQHKSIIEYFFAKLSTLFLDGAKSSISSKLKDEGDKILKSKSNIVKRISSDNSLVRQFEIDVKQQTYTLPQLIPIFNKLCGYAYSRVKEGCEKGKEAEKALAYFGLAAALVNINDWRQLNTLLAGKKGESCLDVFERSSSETVIKKSQQLIVKYFKTD